MQPIILHPDAPPCEECGGLGEKLVPGICVPRRLRCRACNGTGKDQGGDKIVEIPISIEEALATKVTVPAETNQPAPDAPKKNRKGKDDHSA